MVPSFALTITTDGKCVMCGGFSHDKTSSSASKQLPWHEPMLKVERILMADFASTEARAKGVAPSTNRDGR
jgi:hypothetical protein